MGYVLAFPCCLKATKISYTRKYLLPVPLDDDTAFCMARQARVARRDMWGVKPGRKWA